MGTMTVNILGRDYPIACDDGQEAHLGKLTQMVNDRVNKLSQEMGRGPESTMLVYTALMLADELQDARNDVKMLRNELNALSDANTSDVSSTRIQEMENAMVDSMNHIADRIEKIAQQLEAA